MLGNLSAELQVIGRKLGTEKIEEKRTEGTKSSTLIRECDLTDFRDFTLNRFQGGED